MKRKVRKNGCSMIVALTPAAMEQLELEAGDLVDVRVKEKSIIITKVEKKEDKPNESN